MRDPETLDPVTLRWVADRLCGDAAALDELGDSGMRDRIMLHLTDRDLTFEVAKVKRSTARWLRGHATRAEHAAAIQREAEQRRTEAVELARQGELWSK